MQLYSFGSNGHYQLGQNHNRDLDVPTLVDLPYQITRLEPSNLQIRSNGNHTLLLVNNDLYACGDNRHGQCFITNKPKIERFIRIHPTVFAGGVPRLISAGWEFSAVVATDRDGRDRLYCSGIGSRGELGLGENIKTGLIELVRGFPRRGRSIRQIVSGLAHTVVLLDNGELWGWGVSRKGQLGLHAEAQKLLWNPVQIDLKGFHPVKAVCGREFTALIDFEGNVKILFTSKNDRNGILLIPRIESLHSWTDFQSGWSSLHILLPTGKMMSWGNNSHSQLVPHDAPSVQCMAIGSEHTLVWNQSSATVYSWGWGEHGNCGSLDNVTDSNPSRTLTKATRVIQLTPKSSVSVFAGCATSWIAIWNN
ncbi:regulator of chromosome condensation 1/beta-lactamase-inhibitor protein II [Lipomyces oligophaga]|uniref:regulator of chromosome condensation 1/beta-lactamase-inhibitor protein II n=1 Tax=Lipomyces oligophaga TaxID=45792 RepID=UPI0034CD2DA1